MTPPGRCPHLRWLMVLGCAASACSSSAVSYAASPPAVAPQAAAPVTALKNFYVDPFTGSANFTIPLTLPPLHGRLPLSLTLLYSSRAGNGWVGVGWKLNLAAIERSTKRGFPRYDATDPFLVSLGEGQEELTAIGGGEYRFKVAEAAWRFRFDGTRWTAHNPEGLRYEFGRDDALNDFSRTKDPANPSRVFRWRLSRVSDPLGNSVVFQYLADRIVICYTERSEAARGSFRAEDYNYAVTLAFSATRTDRLSNARPSFNDDYPVNGLGRVEDIAMTYRGQLIRHYRLAYTNSPVTGRSMLSTVTESGSDGVTGLPPVRFTYATDDVRYESTVLLSDANELARFLWWSRTHLGDVNGDGLDDFVSCDLRCMVALNEQGRPLPDQQWFDGIGMNEQAMVGDVDGDGRADVCRFDSLKGEWRVALSDGTRFIDQGVWLTGFGQGAQPLLGDFNGDGRMDVGILVESQGRLRMQAAFGTGSGFQPQAFSLDLDTAAPDSSRKLLFGDFNGDGVTDIMLTKHQGASPQEKTVVTIWNYHPSRGWALSAIHDRDPGLSEFWEHQTTSDVDNDGRTDVVYLMEQGNRLVLNVGRNVNGWDTVRSPSKQPLAAFRLGFELMDDFRFGDVNGDGLTDVIAFRGTAEFLLSRNQHPPDLLLSVENGWGGRAAFEYRPSSTYENREGAQWTLPFSIPVISNMWLSDGMGHTALTSYHYAKGLYDTAAKEFRGFGQTTTTDDTGRVTETWFLQDALFKGRMSRQWMKDTDGRTFVELRNAWTVKSLAAGAQLILLDTADRVTYDGNASFKQTRTSFQYDDYGNPTRITNAGDVALTGDEETAVLEYAANLRDWLLSYPSYAALKDANGALIQQRWLTYDGAASSTIAPTKGLLTTEERWLVNPLTPQAASRVTTRYAYDAFGNRTVTTDPLRHETTTTYDPDLHLYPATVTNALTHAMAFRYDPRLAQLLNATDPNGQTTRYVYDPLGRLTAVYGPDDPDGSPGMTVAYDTSNAPLRTTLATKTSDESQPPRYLTRIQFADGLGRPIQTHTPAEPDPATGLPRHVVSDVVTYDGRGRVSERYLPFVRTGAPGRYDADYAEQPNTVVAYDVLDRPTRTTHPDQTFVERRDDDWTTTILDANGHQHVETRDAYGQIVQVDEHNGAQVYTTRYRYDGLHLLHQIVPASNQITTFLHDTLGRQVRLSDPDRGAATFEYDAASNLKTQTDARGVTVTFDYDALNRLTRKSYTIPPGSLVSGLLSPVSYVYDDPAKPFSTGRLTGIAHGATALSVWHDRLGRITKTARTIDGTTFTVERAYDDADRLERLTYPNGKVVTYRHNAAGQVHAVALDGAALIERIEYAPTGQMTFLKYGNGSVSHYTYDPQTLRLSSLVTGHSSLGTVLQDYAYTFDAAGNVKTIQDRVGADSQAFVYDDLDRLARAQGAYGTSLFAYDPLGNLTEKDGRAYAYPASRPHAVQSTSDGTTFEYDEAGNLARRAKGAVSDEFRYDAEHRLVSASMRNSAASPMPPTMTETPVSWVDVLGVTTAGSSLTKRDPDGWGNAGAASAQRLLRNGAVRFRVPASTVAVMCGFSPSNPNASYDTIHYGLYVRFGELQVYERGTHRGSFGSTAPVDQLSVERQGTTIRYAKNGVVFYTSAAPSSNPLVVDGALYTRGGTIADATLLEAKPPVVTTSATTYVYDGQGERVKKSLLGRSTLYVENLYEQDADGTTRFHVFLGPTRLATVETLSPEGAATRSRSEVRKTDENTVPSDRPTRLIPSRPISATRTTPSPRRPQTFEVRTMPDPVGSLSASAQPVSNAIRTASTKSSATSRRAVAQPLSGPSTPRTLSPSVPTIQWIRPAAGSTFTAPAAISLEASAQDPDGTGIKWVEFFQGTQLLKKDFSTPYTYLWNNVAAGTYTLKAVATSKSGTTREATLTVVVQPNTPPTIQWTTPPAGATFAAPATLALAASASDPDGIGLQSVEFFNGAQLLRKDTSAPYTHTWSNVGAGTYTLRAVATDDGGATTVASITVIVRPNTPPAVQWVSPQAVTTFATPATIALEATANDPDGIGIASVEFFQGAQSLGKDYSAPYTDTWLNAPEGTHTLRAVAIDKGGASTTIEVAIRVVAPTVDLLTITAPANGAVVTDSTVQVRYAISPSAPAGARLHLWFDVRPTVVDTDGDGLYEFTGVSRGEHHLTAWLARPGKFGAEEMRLRQVTTQFRTITVDVPPPNQPPQISLLQPQGTDSNDVAASQLARLRASATDPDGTIRLVEFFVDNTKVGEATVPVTGTIYEVEWTPTEAGIVDLKAVATDDQGVRTEADPWLIIVRSASNLRITSLTATPSTVVAEGTRVQLSWSTAGSDSCMAFGGWSGVKATAGTEFVVPQQTTTYTLLCRETGGTRSATRTITVTVEPPPTPFTVKAVPATALPGQSITIEWTAPAIAAGAQEQSRLGLYELSGVTALATQPINRVAAEAGTVTFTTPPTGAGKTYEFRLETLGTSPPWTTQATSNPVTIPPDAPPPRLTLGPPDAWAGQHLVISWEALPHQVTQDDALVLHEVGDETEGLSRHSTLGNAFGSGAFRYPSTQTGKTYEARYVRGARPGQSGVVLATSNPVTIQPSTSRIALTAAPVTALAGQTLTVQWTVPSEERASVSWFDEIGLHEVGVANPLLAVASQPTSGQPTGTWTVENPRTTAGKTYEFRYVLFNRGYASAATSRSIAIVRPPALSFTADPTTVTAGASTRLTWSSTDSTTCQASGGWSGAKPASGEATIQPQANTTYTLTCTGVSNSTVTRSLTVTVIPPAGLTLGPTDAWAGQQLAIEWSVPADQITAHDQIGLYEVGMENPSRLTVSFPSGKASGRSQFISPPTQTGKAYVAKYLRWTGWSTPALVIATSNPVTIQPSTSRILLTATPHSAQPGQSLTVTWTVPAPDVAAISFVDGIRLHEVGVAHDAVGLASALTEAKPTGTMTFDNLSTKSGKTYEFRYLLYQRGNAIAAVSNPIEIARAPTLSLSATPTTITAGASSRLTWSSTDVAACQASGGWSGPKPLSGSETVQPQEDTTYTLSCTGPLGDITHRVTIVVEPPVSLTLFSQEVYPEQPITVDWTINGGVLPTNNDGIGIYEVGAPNPGTSLESSPTFGAWSGSRTFSRNRIGTVEFRYLRNDGRTAIAITPPVTIKPGVELTVTAESASASPVAQADSAAAGSTLFVRWTINQPRQSVTSWIGLYAVGAPDHSPLMRRGTGGKRQGVAVFDRPPTLPGHTYEFRYLRDKAEELQGFSGPVRIDASPALTLSASSTTIPLGSLLRLEWTSVGVTDCRAADGWSGSKATSGTDTFFPSRTTTYALTCTGPAGTVTKSVTVTVGTLPSQDTTPPSIVLLAPADGATVSGMFTIEASVSDNIGVSRVDWLLNGSLLGSTATAPFAFQWETMTVTNAAHVLIARAVDAAGNAATASANVFVMNAMRPTLPPSIIFYHPDHLGSTTVLTDREGRLVQRLSYQPFGDFAGPGPSDGAAVHHYFTGQELDASTQLYHLGARYYDPALGRFIQPDPIIQDVYDPQALNPYSYARNNPIRLIDPTGLSFHSGVGGGFGGGLGGRLGLGTAWDTWVQQSNRAMSDLISGRSRLPLPDLSRPLGWTPSLNATTTLAMQTFPDLTDPFGPFSRTTSSSLTYQQTTSPFGTTTTILSQSFHTALVPLPTFPDPFRGVQDTWRQAQDVAQALGNTLGSFFNDPGRLLGWTGRVLTEVGFRMTGRALGLGGAAIELSPGKAYGGIVGGGMGAFFGRAIGSVFPGPGTVIGGLAGGIGGGMIGGWLGEFFDPW